MGNISPFSIIPYSVRASKKLGNNEKILYAEISARLELPGYCKTTNKEFASFFDVEEHSISRWIRNLETNGFIRVIQNNHKHRRQIYLRKFPVDLEDAEIYRNPDICKFAEAFPGREINIKQIPDFVKMDKLISAVKQSELLSKADNLDLKWLIEHYDKVIAGTWRDFRRKHEIRGTGREYTREEANSFFQNIEDIEI